MNEPADMKGAIRAYPMAGRRVTVVGFGVSGAAAARVLALGGARVTITDASAHPAAPMDRMAELQRLGVRMELGGHDAGTFETADLILVSPGVPETLPPIQAARKRGIPLIGEVELAASLIAAPILAVTGTNGKTTTTSLLGHILRSAGVRVFVGGNIGRPLVDAATESGEVDAVVAEISSFQLDTTELFRPVVSVLLNITEDHLDRYGDMAAYAASKARIFRNQRVRDTAVVNGDDALARQVSRGIRPRRWLYGAGAGSDEGAVLKGRQLMLQAPGLQGQRIDLSGLRIPGRHNLENAAAACLAAVAFGIAPADVEAALPGFEGLAHRMQQVATIGQVLFVNDSKATNVDAVRRALEAFTSPLVLIMGGRDKGGSFDQLAESVRRRVRALILMGEARQVIDRALGQLVPTQAASDLDDAVGKALAAAAPGDTVLLSPGCASFDMFTSYKHRGERFIEAVRSRM
jgi:UDP-N-acetylmuramoylalanine--D-glutamate ligase